MDFKPSTESQALGEQTREDAAPASEVVDRRTNNFDFVRFALAVCVLASHGPVLISGKPESDLLYRLTPDHVSLGFIAVDCFFLISGFLILQSWLFSGSLVRYLRKRVLRIYPAFIAASLFSILIAGAIGASHPLPRKHETFAEHWSGTREYLGKIDRQYATGELERLLLLMPPSSPPTYRKLHYKMVNGSIWTVRYEFACYLFVALFGVVGFYRWRPAILILTCVSYISYVLQTLQVITLSTLDIPILAQLSRWPRLGTYFLLGMTFYTYRQKIRLDGRVALLALAGAAVGCAFPCGTAIALPPCAAYALFYLSFQESGRLRHFGDRGDFSYGLFCFGWPAQCLILWRYQMMNSCLFFICSFCVSLAFAYGSWHCIEKPFLRLKGRRSAPELAGAPPPRVSW